MHTSLTRYIKSIAMILVLAMLTACYSAPETSSVPGSLSTTGYVPPAPVPGRAAPNVGVDPAGLVIRY